MINFDHEAWPDLRRESEIVRLVDRRLNEALAAVAMTAVNRITPHEHEVIEAVGRYDTHEEAGRNIDGGLGAGQVGMNLHGAELRLPGDNKYVKLFNASSASLLYVAGHEGIVSYGTDEDCNEPLTRDQAIGLKIIALSTDERDLRVLVPPGRYNWWSKKNHADINSKLDIPNARNHARTVGRAFQVGLFISRQQAREQAEADQKAREQTDKQA